MSKPMSNLSRRQLLFGLGTTWKERRWKDEETPPSEEEKKAAEEVSEALTRTLENARAAWRNDDPSAAVPLYREYLRVKAEDIGVHAELGVCLYYLEQYIQARVEFERVLRSRKTDDQTALLLGLSLLQKGKLDKARKAFDAYTALDGVKAVIDAHLPNLEQGGDLSDSIAAIEAVLDRESLNFRKTGQETTASG